MKTLEHCHGGLNNRSDLPSIVKVNNVDVFHVSRGSLAVSRCRTSGELSFCHLVWWLLNLLLSLIEILTSRSTPIISSKKAAGVQL